MAYDDDDDDGPGFLTVAALLALTAGGAWFLYRTLTAQAAAGTLPDLLTLPGLNTSGSSGGSGLVVPAGAPVGIQNNNPGNIKWSAANNWDGQLGQDGNGFVIFSDPSYGIRAMFLTVRSYAGELSPFTIQTVGPRWTSGDAPATQAAWMANAAAASGLGQTQVLDPTDTGQMQQLVDGIIAAENGATWPSYYASVVPTAQQMAA